MNWFYRRLCMQFALAALLFLGHAVLAQDTLRPVPWRTAVWDGALFRTEVPAQRNLAVPLALNSVDVSALGSPRWNFSEGLVPQRTLRSVMVGYWQQKAHQSRWHWGQKKDDR